MFQTFRNAWKIPELKNRLLFTLAILVVYRLGCAIPVPFVTSSALTQMFSNGNMLTYLDMMSGGALSRCTLFALGVTPYINASIIVQLLTVAIPSLENIAKEPDGQQKLQQITRYAGGIIALIMSLGYYFVVRNMGALKYTSGAAGIFTAVVIIATFTAGAQLITWCGEQIDDKGIGNGLSLLIFSSIVSNWSSLYTTVAGLLTRAAAGESQFYIFLPLLLVLALVVIVFIVIMTNAERRITIQYAKRVVGRKQMGGQNSYLPLKLNMTGVMPIIFASALVSIPGTIGSFMQVDQAAHPFWYAFFRTFNYTSPLYVVIYLLLLSRLPVGAAAADCAARYAASRNRYVRFQSLMVRLAADPSTALRLMAEYPEPFSACEVGEIMAVLRRGMLPIAYEPLIGSPSRNLRIVGLNIVRQFGIEEAERLLLRIVSGDEDPGLVREALYTLCALRRPLTRRAVSGRLSAMPPAERKALLRYVVAEGYSPGPLRRLLDERERPYYESLVQTYKRSLA